MHHVEAIARRKLKGPPEWEYCCWERIEPDMLIVEGGVPIPGKTGPARWRHVELGKTVVTDAERTAEFARYEAETGTCGTCLGTREVFHSWNHLTGTKMKPCPRCNATGKAPA